MQLSDHGSGSTLPKFHTQLPPRDENECPPPTTPRLAIDSPARRAPAVEMITKFMTEVTAKFNPFSPCAKPARLFLTFLPPAARANGMAINTMVLPRTATEPSSLLVKFKDGKELNFNCEQITIKGVVEELDRHSRQLQKAADLTD